MGKRQMDTDTVELSRGFACVTVVPMGSLYVDQGDCEHRMNFNMVQLVWE